MKVLFIFLYLVSASVAGTSASFLDSFRSHLEIRRLEEESTLLTSRTGVEEGAKIRDLRQLDAKLTEARIIFHASLPGEEAKLSTWEKEMLARIEKKKAPKFLKVDEEAMAFLTKTFPQPQKLSALEWQVVGELFGPATQDRFLQQAFGLEPVTKAEEILPVKQSFVWVTTPSFPILPGAEAERQKALRKQATSLLRARGYEVEELSVSPYTTIEAQAEDLQKSLKNRLEKGSYHLLSHGVASAVLLRTLDLYPELLKQPEILGWLNLNGALYGGETPLAPSGRKPASFTKQSAADRLDLEVAQEMLRMRIERVHRAIPLSAAFPVVNLVTLAGKYRPASNLRESLVPEGRTLYLPEGEGFAGLEAAVSALSAARRSATEPKSK